MTYSYEIHIKSHCSCPDYEEVFEDTPFKTKEDLAKYLSETRSLREWDWEILAKHIRRVD